ncbi:NADP-dependent oxidoreductase [Streptomyces melanogenes]|uniref:NADP-dependent oxidoreductase n=1 Tax=Streptomyces melanogenes TaxID=67326 RepID=UPI00167E4B17|nr:NADP-dependent oxidoreductase [Streptomyces melanogenes]GGP70549.1 NADPH:quinone reductase [Streptomyces melanogenes]
MRAVAVQAFGATPEVVHVPKPTPGPGEVLVKIDYAALNPFDWQVADGLLDGRAPHAFPLVLGLDFAGRVDVVGPGENRFVVGDAVYGQAGRPPVGTGTYAEYVTMPHDSTIAGVPDGLTLRAAAALPTAGMTALQILRTGVALEPGDSLLLVGAAGGVGSALTQLAAARDLRVVAVVRGDERERMRALGAVLAIDSTEESVREACGRAVPGGVDAVVDLVSPDPESFAAYASLMRPGGAALSTRGAAPPGKGVNFRLTATGALLDALAAAAVAGEVHLPVDAEYPLEKVPEALERNRVGGARGKTLFVP